MDHTREDCVTALPNLVTGDFREKKSHLECCYAKKLFTHVFNLKKKKPRKRLTIVWGGKQDTVFRKRPSLSYEKD